MMNLQSQLARELLTLERGHVSVVAHPRHFVAVMPWTAYTPNVERRTSKGKKVMEDPTAVVVAAAFAVVALKCRRKEFIT